MYSIGRGGGGGEGAKYNGQADEFFEFDTVCTHKDIFTSSKMKVTLEKNNTHLKIISNQYHG